MGGTVAIPVWAFPLALSLALAAATFLWGLASRANRAADALEEATRRLLALESRIAAIAPLETAVAVLRAEHNALVLRVGHLVDDVRNATRSSRDPHA